jgi:hypothetical protein
MGAFYLLFSKLQPECKLSNTAANGASYMYHLLPAVNAHAEKIQPCSEVSLASDRNDPLVILPMDSKTAFNTLNSQQLVRFLQEGCETHAPSLRPSNQYTADPSPYGWDALCPYFAAHYGCHSSLKYYSSGTTSVVQSQSSRVIIWAAPCLL